MAMQLYPWTDDEEAVGDWTPERGIRRALAWGVLAALVCGAVLNVPVFGLPPATLQWPFRLAFAFAVTWVLFRVVHRAAGMAGTFCTTLVVVLSLLVMLSQYVVLAMHDESVLDPAILCISFVPTLIGVGFCAWLCHHGGDDLSIITDIFRFWPRR